MIHVALRQSGSFFVIKRKASVVAAGFNRQSEASFEDSPGNHEVCYWEQGTGRTDFLRSDHYMQLGDTIVLGQIQAITDMSSDCMGFLDNDLVRQLDGLLNSMASFGDTAGNFLVATVVDGNGPTESASSCQIL